MSLARRTNLNAASDVVVTLSCAGNCSRHQSFTTYVDEGTRTVPVPEHRLSQNLCSDFACLEVGFACHGVEIGFVGAVFVWE
jgi:hypothetical protein